MKLLIILSVIACSYAAKLDRTYLPPASAASAGGSPGSLSAPIGPTGPSGSGFGQPNAAIKSNPAFGNGYQPPSGQFGQPSGPSFDASFGQSQKFGNQAQDYQRNQPERAQASEDRNAQILRSDSQNDGENFSYSFETSNGIAAEESGTATNGVHAQGAFSYSGDDGQSYRVVYTADENGYQPQGDHLPTPHPIPEEILKSIEQNARAAAAGTQEGAYNPEEDNKPSIGYNQYNNNAPTSYGQASTAQSGAYNQAENVPQLYAAPNAGAPSRAQGPQGNQGPSQQYGTPSGTPGFSQAKSPSQLYDSPNANSARPNSFNQGPSGFGSSNGLAPSGPSSQARPNQAPSNQFGRIQANQAQDESGYQYNQPQQVSSFGRDSNNARPNFPQAGAQPSRSQGFGAGLNQGSFTPNNVQPSRPQGYNAGPSQGQHSSSPSSQGYNARPSQGQFSGTSPSAQGNIPSFPKGNTNTQSSFGAPAGSLIGSAPAGPTSYRPKAGQNFGNAQGSQGSESGYEYNRPQANAQRPQGGFNGAQGGFNAAQGGFKAAPGGFNAPAGIKTAQNGFNSSPQGQSFGAPRQPPSFTEEEGYKY